MPFDVLRGRCNMRSPLSLCCVTTAALLGAVSAASIRAWDQDLYLLESRDGVRFGRPVLFVEGGGAAAFEWFPDVVRRHELHPRSRPLGVWRGSGGGSDRR